MTGIKINQSSVNHPYSTPGRIARSVVIFFLRRDCRFHFLAAKGERVANDVIGIDLSKFNPAASGTSTGIRARNVLPPVPRAKFRRHLSKFRSDISRSSVSRYLSSTHAFNRSIRFLLPLRNFYGAFSVLFPVFRNSAQLIRRLPVVRMRPWLCGSERLTY